MDISREVVYFLIGETLYKLFIREEKGKLVLKYSRDYEYLWCLDLIFNIIR